MAGGITIGAGGICIGAGGIIISSASAPCCFVQLLSCDDDSESGFWLRVSDIPDNKLGAKLDEVCYYFSDPQPCIPSGDTLLDPGDVTFEDDCDACGGTPCYYKLVPCAGLFSEALLLVPCSSVPEGKTSVIIGGICYVIDEQVHSVPPGYTVVTPASPVWSVDCPTCIEEDVTGPDCPSLCGRCPTEKAVVVDITITSGDEVRHYYGTANVVAPDYRDGTCFNYELPEHAEDGWLWLDYDDPAATEEDPGESFHGYVTGQFCGLRCNSGTGIIGSTLCSPPGYTEIAVLTNTFQLTCSGGRCVCCPHGSVTSFPGLAGWSGSITV